MWARSFAWMWLASAGVVHADSLAVSASAGSGIAEGEYRQSVGAAGAISVRYAGWPECCVIVGEWARVDHRAFERYDRFRSGIGTAMERRASERWRYSLGWAAGAEVIVGKIDWQVGAGMDPMSSTETYLGVFALGIANLTFDATDRISIGPEAQLSISAHRAETDSEAALTQWIGVDVTVGLVARVAL